MKNIGHDAIPPACVHGGSCRICNAVEPFCSDCGASGAEDCTCCPTCGGGGVIDRINPYGVDSMGVLSEDCPDCPTEEE